MLSTGFFSHTATSTTFPCVLTAARAASKLACIPAQSKTTSAPPFVSRCVSATTSSASGFRTVDASNFVADSRRAAAGSDTPIQDAPCPLYHLLSVEKGAFRESGITSRSSGEGDRSADSSVW